MDVTYKPEWTDIFNPYAAGDKTALRAMPLPDRFAYAAWAAQQKGGRLGVLTSLGAQAIVNLHAVKETGLDIPVVFIDTGYQFKETVAYRETLEHAGYEIKTYTPAPGNQMLSKVFVDNYFQEWAHDRDDWSQDAAMAFDALGLLAKRATRDEAERELGVTTWATGRRRDQTDQRGELPIFTFDQHGGLIEFNPLADWTSRDIRAYQETHDLLELRHPFCAKGATAIGYKWESLFGKGECNLHPPEEQDGRIVDVVGKPLLLEAA